MADYVLKLDGRPVAVAEGESNDSIVYSVFLRYLTTEKEIADASITAMLLHEEVIGMIARGIPIRDEADCVLLEGELARLFPKDETLA